MSFPVYSQYKDSGVEWLGKVPEHWSIVRLGTLFNEAEDEAEGDLPILSVSIHDGVSDRELAPDETERKVSRSEDRSKYKRVRPGDLVYNMMRAWQGGFGTVQVEGLVSPAYIVARPVQSFQTEFVEAILRTPNAIEEMRRHSQGVTDFRLRLYWEEFKTIRIPLPPTPEQDVIATFIRHQTAKIDALIEDQQRLIELLEEKRQAVVSYAITKGLNRNAPFKDSGVEWLGEVPAHWNVSPLKYVVSLRSGGTPSKEVAKYWGGEIPWASAKDLKSEILADTQDHITEIAIQDRAADLVAAGSVLVLVRGMMLARAFPVCQISVPMAINQDLKALNGQAGISNNYLAWLLRGTAQESLNRLDEAGHGTKALRMDAWLSMAIPVPPPDEQEAISAYIEREVSALDTLRAEAEAAIALLQERRSTLISAAVTGKIDVRDLALANAEAA